MAAEIYHKNHRALSQHPDNVLLLTGQEHWSALSNFLQKTDHYLWELCAALS